MSNLLQVTHFDITINQDGGVINAHQPNVVVIFHMPMVNREYMPLICVVKRGERRLVDLCFESVSFHLIIQIHVALNGPRNLDHLSRIHVTLGSPRTT